jgi:hypothetical protein
MKLIKGPDDKPWLSFDAMECKVAMVEYAIKHFGLQPTPGHTVAVAFVVDSPSQTLWAVLRAAPDITQLREDLGDV